LTAKRNNKTDLLYLIENTFDRKRIYANPSAYPNPNSNPNTNPNPESQLCFRTDEMTSFFDQVKRYPIRQQNTTKNGLIYESLNVLFAITINRKLT